MADKKISELTALTGANVATDDQLVIVDTSAALTKNITIDEFKNALDTATGFVRITGDTMTGDLSMGDNVKAIFGAGSDLQIYHSGTHSYIQDLGTGSLRLVGADIEFLNEDFSDFFAKFANNGASTFYYNGSPKLATTSTGIDVTGTVTADDISIADTSPTLLFNRTDRATDNKIIRFAHDGEDFQIQLANDAVSSVTPAIAINRTGMTLDSIAFYEDTGTTAKFFWDSSAESLGIGTSSPSYPLHISTANLTQARFESIGTSGSYVQWRDADTTSGQAAWIGSDGDLFKFYSNNNTLNMTMTTAGNVGIGTSSPSESLTNRGNIFIETNSTSADSGGGLFWQSTTSGWNTSAAHAAIYGKRTDASNGYLRFDTRQSGTTQEAMRIDSSGNVGIGTDAPSDLLELSGNTAQPAIRLTDTDVSGLYHRIFTPTNTGLAISADTGNVAADSFVRFDVDGTEAMRIDSSGNVGIGTDSPSYLIHADAATATDPSYITASSGSDFIVAMGSQNSAGVAQEAFIGTLSNDALKIKTNNTERMRIDSSGNLLVGKTTTPIADDGIQLSSGDYMTVTRTGAELMYLNRKGSGGTENGDIIKFYSNTAQVGSIGSRGGVATNLILRTATGQGAGIGGANSGVLPCDEDGLQDDEINLGASGTRWKDLYLSSSIILQRAESASVGTFGRNTDGTARTLFTFRSESQNATVGTITVTNSTTAYNTSSDYRLKTDAQPMTGATDRLKQLNPVNFEWIADGTRVDGFLAHEAQAVVPEAVTGVKDAMRDEEYEVTPAVTDDDGNVVTEAVIGTRSVPDYQGIDQSKLVPLLVATIKELEARITALENA